MDAIVVDGLEKTYGKDTRALDGIRFSVEEGDVFGLLGPNGAGKSTTVRILATLTKADAGRATVSGHDVATEAAAVRRAIGYVPQASGVDREATGRENLLLQGRLQGMRGAELERRADELLERLRARRQGERAREDLLGRHEAAARRRDRASSIGRTCSSSTSRRPASTPRRARRCGRSSSGSPRPSGSRSSSRRTTSRRPTGSPSASRSSSAAGSSSRARRRSSSGSCAATPSWSSSTDGDGARAAEARRARSTGCTRSRPTGAGCTPASTRARSAVPVILAALDAAGAGVHAVTVSRPSLDDVYLHHTGRDFRADDEGDA